MKHIYIINLLLLIISCGTSSSSYESTFILTEGIFKLTSATVTLENKENKYTINGKCYREINKIESNIYKITSSGNCDLLLNSAIYISYKCDTDLLKVEYKFDNSGLVLASNTTKSGCKIIRDGREVISNENYSNSKLTYKVTDLGYQLIDTSSVDNSISIIEYTKLESGEKVELPTATVLPTSSPQETISTSPTPIITTSPTNTISPTPTATYSPTSTVFPTRTSSPTPTISPTPPSSPIATFPPFPTFPPIATPIVTSTPPPTGSTLYVYGYESSSSSYSVFLGCLTCSSLASNSITNPYGTYGSAYSSLSINNQFSDWGSHYRSYSACNEYILNPPKVIGANNALYGYWTLNQSKTNRITNPTYLSLLINLCSE